MRSRYKIRPSRQSPTPGSYFLQLLIVFFVGLLILSLYGCGKKQGGQGPIGYPGAAGPKGEQGEAGAPGADGADATLPAYVPVGVVDPCGDAPGIVDEVLIVLANGQVLVSFSDHFNGNNTRLALLPAGSYVTTDGSACSFSLSASGTITY
jgi:hypothetical protein